MYSKNLMLTFSSIWISRNAIAVPNARIAERYTGFQRIWKRIMC